MAGGLGVPPSAVSPSALFKPLALYDPGLMGPGYLPPHVHPLAAYPTALMNQLYALPYTRPDHYALLERHSALAKGRPPRHSQHYAINHAPDTTLDDVCGSDEKVGCLDTISITLPCTNKCTRRCVRF